MIRLSQPGDHSLTIAPDVTTGLHVLGREPARPIWAAAGAGALARVALAEDIRHVEMAVPKDCPEPHMRALIAMTHRLLDDGRAVRWFEVVPPR